VFVVNFVEKIMPLEAPGGAFIIACDYITFLKSFSCLINTPDSIDNYIYP